MLGCAGGAPFAASSAVVASSPVATGKFFDVAVRSGSDRRLIGVRIGTCTAVREKSAIEFVSGSSHVR